MAILKIEDKFSSFLATKFNKLKLKHNSDIIKFLDETDEIQNISNSISKLLSKDYFVVLKNFNLVDDKNLFFHFSSLFGEVYPEIDFTDIKIDCPYTGCVSSYLVWHTDDAILGNLQPKYSTLYIIEEDPLKLPQNGILDIDDLVYYLELNDIDFLEELLTKEFPMLSKGVHYYDSKKEDISISQTLLYEEDNEIKVRFDLHRIKSYYFSKNIKQSIEEKKIINKFLTLADKLKKSVYLEKHDFLILNNRKTLHDRSECSLELNQDGSFNTREIFVGFIVE
ncbi:MAG: TauD/TfdA family dioxygenase [Sulfurovum sp.]|nr:TauD/TfdA family dioxygenase [Sulfurovum sp.]